MLCRKLDEVREAKLSRRELPLAYLNHLAASRGVNQGDLCLTEAYTVKIKIEYNSKLSR